ncbi:O-antigen ligase family protein [Haloarcula quadrata]|nr:O-antigen ligase family protein [Haloarcula quadrata]
MVPLVICHFVASEVTKVRLFHFYTFVLLFFLVSFLGIGFSNNPVVATKALFREVAYFAAVFIGLITFLPDRSYIYRAIELIIISGVGVGLLGIFQQLNSGFVLYGAHASPFFNEHGTFGVMMSYCLIYSLVMWRSTAKLTFLNGSLLKVSSTIFLLATFLSYSKAAWVSILVSVLLLAILWGMESDRDLSQKIPGLGALVVLPPVILSLAILAAGIRLDELAYYFSLEYSSNQERINRFAAAVNMAMENPFTGVGVRNYVFVYEDYKSIVFNTIHADSEGLTSHNMYLKILANRGFVAFGLFIQLLLVYILDSLNMIFSMGKRDRDLIIAGLVGNISYMVHWLANTLWVGRIEAVFWFSISITYLVYSQKLD